jgi:hypothetical protein
VKVDVPVALSAVTETRLSEPWTRHLSSLPVGFFGICDEEHQLKSEAARLKLDAENKIKMVANILLLIQFKFQ